MHSGCRRNRARDRTRRSTVESVVDAFIEAQEQGDREGILDFIVARDRKTFKEVLQGLDDSDIVATGLQFREENYQLEELSDDMAIFWSPSAKLYLVLVLEEDTWRIDPGKTDEMNIDDGD